MQYIQTNTRTHIHIYQYVSLFTFFIVYINQYLYLLCWFNCLFIIRLSHNNVRFILHYIIYKNIRQKLWAVCCHNPNHEGSNTCGTLTYMCWLVKWTNKQTSKAKAEILHNTVTITQHSLVYHFRKTESGGESQTTINILSYQLTC